MLRQSAPMAGHFPQLVNFPFYSGSGYGDRQERKRWGEYRTDEPDAHGGFGKTDGFSKYRTNVDLCHPIPEKTDIKDFEGFMLPRALVTYDMTKETHVEHNHNRRFKQNKVMEVFPLSDPERKDGQANPILSQSIREGLDSNTIRFYQSTRNQRVFLDHTAEIRRRVAEKIRRKRTEELKAAIRMKAFLNPTPEIWAQYREICSIEYDLDGVSDVQGGVNDFIENKDNLVLDYNVSPQQEIQGDAPMQVTGMAAPQTDNGEMYSHMQLNDTYREQYLPHINVAENPESSTTQRHTNTISLVSSIPLKGILKNSHNDTNQFARPWADPKMAMKVSSWKPYNRCIKRPSRRVRFKDEIFNILEQTPVDIRVPTPHVTSFFPASCNKNAREFEEPEALYYDKELCTNIPARLGLQFKSEACKRFHQKYPDPIPDLRGFRIYPKKHFFYNGHHTSVLRG